METQVDREYHPSLNENHINIYRICNELKIKKDHNHLSKPATLFGGAER